MHNKLTEGLEQNDLARLLRNELHIDQFKSKMGDDADVIVLSFKIKDKEPAVDLVDFIEKGYDWVLDGDISSGEKEDGDYLVFVELNRDAGAPDNIMKLVGDVSNLVEFELDDWHWKYQKELKDYKMTEEQLTNVVPLTPQAYKERIERVRVTELDHMRAVAGVTVTTTAPKDDFTESLRIAAGIR